MFPKFLKAGKFAASIERPKTKNNPLTRGSAAAPSPQTAHAPTAFD